eukprot:TRINITY_DN5719_c0_g1_i2.p3 TRINITY_DN5719_c0_g1~~TRINITY_DN5719_c0_g1_i2.p3  ORF type:complete len:100 (+),score=6.41 TRINITY_DN5719_c0_g1_i2:541-840(+)
MSSASSFIHQNDEQCEKEGGNSSSMKRSPSMESLGGVPRTCVCAPTTHAGSFRCRLHRNSSLHSNANPSHHHPPVPPQHHHHPHHHQSPHHPPSTVEAK